MNLNAKLRRTLRRGSFTGTSGRTLTARRLLASLNAFPNACIFLAGGMPIVNGVIMRRPFA